MLLSVVHTTRYTYSTEVARSTQYIRLTPYAGALQRTLEWAVELPAPAVTMRDAFDNLTHLLVIDRPHTEIGMVARGTVDVADVDDGEPAGRINPKVFLRSTRLTDADDGIRAFVESMRGVVRSRPLIAVSDLMNAVLDRMPERAGVTTAETTAEQAFAIGAGVAQDQTHVFIACCRALGVPARYVSGYAYSPDQEYLTSHAWAEAWLGTRWVSFDVSNARKAGTSHIKLALGLDYLDACPVRGVRLGGEQESLATEVRIRRA
jgi:transglutaminase-like putative cysteine protease